MNNTRVVMLVVVIGLAVALVSASPAHARNYDWQEGRKISSYPSSRSIDVDAVVRWSKGKCPQLALTSIKMRGDYLYVRDDCSDGLSAVGIWRDGKTGKEFVCRNKHGKGSKVRCKFNWPERQGSFIPGVSSGRSIKYRDHGNSLLMDQQGNSCSASVTGPTPCS